MKELHEAAEASDFPDRAHKKHLAAASIISRETETDTVREEVDEVLELFFEDLTEEAKKAVVDFLGDNCNYDIMPIVTLRR